MFFNVKVSARKSLWAELIPDDGINKGGYYCKLYHDCNKEFLASDFTLSRNYFKSAIEPSRKMALAQSLACEMAKNMYR